MERPGNEMAFDADLYAFDIDASVKLDMLYVELDRVETTIELQGNPYVFLDNPEQRFSADAGKRRFCRHTVWLRDSICGHVDPACTGEDLYECILNQIRDSGLHDRTLWVLAHILALQGIEELCVDEAT